MSHGMRRNGNKPTIIDHRVPANQKAGSDRYGITGKRKPIIPKLSTIQYRLAFKDKAINR